MEQTLILVWTCLLRAGLALVQPPPAFPATAYRAGPRAPTLNRCVFIIRSDVTCYWEPGEIPVTQYTLEVQRRPTYKKESIPAKNFTCTTTGTNCTIAIPNLTVRIYYCIRIIAHNGHINISSSPRCQLGRIEAMLPPVNLCDIKQVPGSPDCLTVVWNRQLSNFSVSDEEIQEGHLNSQIEFKSQTQPTVHVHNVSVTGFSVLVCLFKPDTSYTIRLRNRYQGEASPWSSWSNQLQGKTSEDAPSAAPSFWRQVKHTDVDKQRLVSLLWKPLPPFLANGRVLFYNVTCQTENAQPLSDHGNCRDLLYSNTSCSFPQPASRCSCALTASTAAGASPEAKLWFLGTTETELPPPSQISVRRLDDSSLEVKWPSPKDRSVSGFVVEWFAVREKISSILHWEKFNISCTTLVMTEGVKPMERYAVSVKMLYGKHGPGKNTTLHCYTRQGTPSAGPNVKVQKLLGNSVELSWSPVPVELLHGFLSNYTLSFATRSQIIKSVIVPNYIHHWTENLSPGNYEIFMRASTAVGTGPNGTLANVHIGSEDSTVVSVMSVIVALMVFFLVFIACMLQMKMIKQRLYQGVPDPSNSSLSQWTSETILKRKSILITQDKPDIRYAEIILPDKLQDLEEDDGYEGLQKYSIHQFSSLPGRTSGTELTTCVTKAEETLVTDPSTSLCNKSDIVYYQTFINCLQPPLFSPTHQSSDCEPPAISFDAFLLQLSRSSESSDLHPTNEEKISTSLSPVLFSHQNEFSRINSVLPLQPNTICQPQAWLFPHSDFVDYDNHSVECDPYIPFTT